MPFVLVWSLLEAMSRQHGCRLRTLVPWRELDAGEDGLLVDFHNPKVLAGQVIEVLSGAGLRPSGTAAT